MEPSDGQVLSESADDPERFLVIFERYFQDVFRFVSRQLGQPDAEDATAEVFLRALKGAPRYEPRTDSARPWLLGIATNVIRAQLRLRYDRERERGQMEAAQGDRATAFGAIEELADVQRALRSVPPDEREPLLLFAWFDMPYEEVAAALHVPIGTVRSRIARARRRLRKDLGLEGIGITAAT
jgi:RNA polymerase sigma factor (sigma-70 family)